MISKRIFSTEGLTRPMTIRKTPDQTEITEVVGRRIINAEEVMGNMPVHVEDKHEIDRMVDACTRQVEDYIRQDVIQKKITSFWKRNQREVNLSRGPHGEIIEALLIDPNGFERTLVEGVDYKVEGLKYKTLYDFQESGVLTVKYMSGYEKSLIPPQVPQAILQEVNLQYKNRQDPDTPGMTSVKGLSLEARHLLQSLIRHAY